MSLLEIKNLHTTFQTADGEVQAVRGISLSVEQGEILGIVGESGSGKSQSMYSVMGLLAQNGQITEGSITFMDEEISPTSFPNNKQYEKKMNTLRGNKIGMIFQDPISFLNPVLTIGDQLTEPLLNHTQISRAEAKKRAILLLEQVGIPAPESRMGQYPHEFSGGMRQRIIIAIALACNPKLIIADEPTTALDVTIQAKILRLIKEQKEKLDCGVILITHDLGVVANSCNRIAIMYGGKIVETGSVQEIFYAPKHPYTKGLLSCVHNPLKQHTLQPIPGSPPDLLKPPSGCPFVDRCNQALRICKTHWPDHRDFSKTHRCFCWLHYNHPMNTAYEGEEVHHG